MCSLPEQKARIFRNVGKGPTITVSTGRVVFAYFDETARDGFTAVAGYLFDVEGRSRFREQYISRLEHRLPPNKRGQRVFHAAPCYDGAEEYFGIQQPVRDFFLAEMARTIQESASLGIVVGVDGADYRAGISTGVFKVVHGSRPADSLEPWVGSPYSLCLFRCVQGINDWLTARGVADARVKYSMEAGDRQEQEATEVFSRIVGSDIMRDRYRVADYEFVAKGPHTPWLFAADCLAWWWQRNHHVSARDNDAPSRWQKAVVPLIETVPHLAQHMTDVAIGVQGLVNAFYGMQGPDVDQPS